MSLKNFFGFDNYPDAYNDALPGGTYIRRLGDGSSRFAFTATGTAFGTGKCLHQNGAVSGVEATLAATRTPALNLGSVSGNLVVGMRVLWPGNSGEDGDAIFCIANTNGDQIAGLWVKNTGYLEAHGGADIGVADDSGVVGSISTFPLAANEWNFIEAEIGASKFQVWVNGNSVLNFTDTLPSTDPANAWASGPADLVLLAGGRIDNGTVPIGCQGMKVDDVYMLDTTGGTHTARLGDRRVERRRADAVAANSGYAAVGGSSVLDRLDSFDGLTSGYEADTDGDSIRYSSTDTLTSTPVSVTAVKASHVTRKTGASEVTIEHVFESGGTFANGGAANMSASDAQYDIVKEQDPDAGPGAWTKSAVDAVTWGQAINQP